MPGEGRDAQPLTAPHASGVNGGQTTGQTPQVGAPASGARCGSCGGPSGGAELCPACEQAFSAMLRNARPSAPAAPPPAAPSTKPPESAHVDASLWSQLMNTPPPPKSDAFEPPPAAVAPLAVAAPPPPPPQAALPPVALPQAGAGAAAIRAAQLAIAQAAKLEPIKLEEPRPGPTSAHGAAPPIPKHVAPERPVHETPVAKAPRPAPVPASKPSVLVGLLPSRTDRMAAALALLFVLGMGTAGWIRYRDARRDAALEKLLAAQEQEAAEAAAAAPEPAPEPEVVEPPPAVKPRKPIAPSVAPPVASRVAATRPKTDTPPTPEPEPAPAPSKGQSGAPLGPIFQTTQVNQPPRVMWRVEPRLPAAVRGRNDIVIVRALVSPDGQPSRTTLLRRSQSGPDVDDAVLAAVNQWTFAPAKKHGTPVSCWFNFAVTLGRPQ